MTTDLQVDLFKPSLKEQLLIKQKNSNMKLCLIFLMIMIIGSIARLRESKEITKNRAGNTNHLNSVLMKFIRRKYPNLNNDHQLKTLKYFKACFIRIQENIQNEKRREQIYWEKEGKKARILGWNWYIEIKLRKTILELHCLTKPHTKLQIKMLQSIHLTLIKLDRIDFLLQTPVQLEIMTWR